MNNAAMRRVYSSRPVACLDLYSGYGDGRCAVLELRQLLLLRHDLPNAQESAAAETAREVVRRRFGADAAMLLRHERVQSAAGFGDFGDRVASSAGA